MKSLKSIILCGLGVAALSLTSCNDWLDVNTDPDNPSAMISVLHTLSSIPIALTNLPIGAPTLLLVTGPVTTMVALTGTCPTGIPRRVP